MAFPILAYIASQAALSGLNKVLGDRAASRAEQAKSRADSFNTIARLGSGGQFTTGTKEPTGNPLDRTQLDDMAQQALFNQIFKGIFSPAAPAATPPVPVAAA